MQGNKRKLSLRHRISEIEKRINYIMQSLDSLIKTSNVLASTFEQYISMNKDTEKFVKYLEKVIKDENTSAEKRKKKSSKGSGTATTSGKTSKGL